MDFEAGKVGDFRNFGPGFIVVQKQTKGSSSPLRWMGDEKGVGVAEKGFRRKVGKP